MCCNESFDSITRGFDDENKPTKNNDLLKSVRNQKFNNNFGTEKCFREFLSPFLSFRIKIRRTFLSR